MMQSRGVVLAVALAAVTAVGVVSAGSAVGAQTITTIAGTGAGAIGPGIDGEPAAGSAVDHPRGLDVSPAGEMLVAEPFRHTVRRIDAAGRIARVAGTGARGFSGDGGPAVSAQLDGAHGVAYMAGGGFILADTGNHRIRRVWPDGTITTVAGTGEPGYSGDGGLATAARLEAPRGVAALPDGGFLVPDTGNYRVRRVWPDGTITTVAGSGVRGYGGDGGPALAAQLALPFSAVPLADGGVLIADTANHRVRRVLPGGSIVTVAGAGVPGSGGDGGPATQALLDAPHAVAALPDGGFLVADTLNHRMRRVWPDGTITTVAGTGTPGFAGDGGPAEQAQLNLPKAVAVLPDRSGFVIGDAGNNRVRLVRTDLRPTVRLRIVNPELRVRAGQSATLRYVLSEAAPVRLWVLKKGRTVLGAAQRGAQGANRLTFGRQLKAGAYALRLVATTADGRAARANGSLIVRP